VPSIVAVVLLSFSSGPWNIELQARAADVLPLSERFSIARAELDKKSTGLARLEGDVEAENWKDIVSFTKEYDAVMRKEVIASAGKATQSTELKDKTKKIAESLMYDLIGMNKVSTYVRTPSLMLNLRCIHAGCAQTAEGGGSSNAGAR
jgi:hypothetical protein